MQYFLRAWRLWLPALSLSLPFLLLASPAQAQSQAGQPLSLSLREALTRTLEQSPALAAYPYRLRAADAAILQAGIRPSPTLSLELENLALDGNGNGFDDTEITVALSQMIELGGKRQQRLAVTTLALEGERLAYEFARQDVLAETVRRYLDLAEGEARLAAARRALNTAGQAEQAGRHRVQAGAAPETELARLRLARQQADIRLRRAEMERDTSSQQLAALWGATQAGALRAASGLWPLPTLPPVEQVRAQLEQSPQLLQLVNQTRLREAQARLAQAEGRRDITVSLGARHARLTDDNSLLLGVATPLNLRNPNRGNIARAEAELAESEALTRARRIALLAELEALYQSLTLIREELALIDTEALPLARTLYRDVEAGYRAGRYSLLALISAQQEQLALEETAIALAARFHQQRNELERLTGLDLATSLAAAGAAQEDTP